MIQPVFEKVNFEQRHEDKKEQIKIECKSQLESEEVKSILLVSPFSYVEVVDASAPNIKYNGKATFYISYINNLGEVKKCECGSDFNGAILCEDLKENPKVNLGVSVEKVEYDLSGAHLIVSAILQINAKISSSIKENALIGGEDIFTEDNEICILQGLGKRVGGYPVEEQFELSYPVEEVLYQRAQAIITSTQCGVGCIIIDGEVHLSLVLLQKSEKRDIIKEERVLPFRMELECEEAMPNMQATAMVKEKSFKTDVGVDEQGGLSSVNAYISLQFEGEAFSPNTCSIIKDAFSTKNEIEIIKSCCCHHNPLELRSQRFNFSDKCQIGEIPIGAVILAVCAEKASVLSISCQEQKLMVTGIYNACVFLKDGDNKIFTRKVEIPFENAFDLEFDCDTEFECVANTFFGSAKILSATEMQVGGEINLTIYPTKKCGTTLIKDISILEEKKENEYPISVYLALKDEESFSLAKRLNVCPETLIATNKDLQFPLLGNERIVIYRQK